MRRAPRAPTWGPHDPLVDRPGDETIDLHGASAELAAARLRKQLAVWARTRPGVVVHIITGKGRGSPGKPVLKPRVLGLIKGELAPLISDWARDEDEAGFLVKLR